MFYKKLKAFEKHSKEKATTSNSNEVSNSSLEMKMEIEMKEELFPDERSVFAILGKISEMFPQEQIELMDKELLLDFAKMAACLTPEAVAKQLNNLSNDLTARLIEKKLIDSNSEIKRKSNHDYTSNYKVLSQLMEEWAYKNGFNQGANIYCLDKKREGSRVQVQLPPMTPVVFGQLKGSAFRGVLQALGYIFKDLGVSVRHGEFTHFFALYCIVEMNREKQFLKHSVIDLYKKLGSYPYINFLTNKTIWDIIFDSREPISLNSPEVLNDAIRGIHTENAQGSMKKMPVKEMQTLTDIVTGRFIKRSSQMGEKKIVANEAMEKYKNLPGLVIDDAIFFKNSEAESFLFDNIESECSYDPTLASLYSAPKIPTNATCIEKIRVILDPEDSDEKKSGIRKILKTICQNIDGIYGETQSHRAICSYLSKTFIDHPDELYLRFLINCAQAVLLENDLKPENIEHNSKKSKTRNF